MTEQNGILHRINAPLFIFAAERAYVAKPPLKFPNSRPTTREVPAGRLLHRSDRQFSFIFSLSLSFFYIGDSVVEHLNGNKLALDVSRSHESDSKFFASFHADKSWESREDLNGFTRSCHCGDVMFMFFFFGNLLMHALPALEIFKSLLADCWVFADINAIRKTILFANHS